MAVNNLYVTYDHEGQPHFHINDEEVTKEVWMQRHPNMKEDKGNGRNPNSGRVGRVDQGAVTPEQRQRLRDYRDSVKAAAQAPVQAEGGQGTGA